jgi:hypothetical protein
MIYLQLLLSGLDSAEPPAAGLTDNAFLNAFPEFKLTEDSQAQASTASRDLEIGTSVVGGAELVATTAGTSRGTKLATTTMERRKCTGGAGIKIMMVTCILLHTPRKTLANRVNSIVRGYRSWYSQV